MDENDNYRTGAIVPHTALELAVEIKQSGQQYSIRWSSYIARMTSKLKNGLNDAYNRFYPKFPNTHCFLQTYIPSIMNCMSSLSALPSHSSKHCTSYMGKW